MHALNPPYRHRGKPAGLALLVALALAGWMATAAAPAAWAQAPEKSLEQLIEDARKKLESEGASKAQLQKLIEGLGAGYGEFHDYRHEMRRFVQNISDYSRTLNRDFIVIAEDPLSLIRIFAPDEENHLQPAEDFINGLDGILVHEIATTTGKPLSEEAMIERQDSLDVASAYDLVMMAVEFASTPEAVDAAYAANKDRGILSFVTGDQTLSSLPTYPVEPYASNSDSITSIQQARNFLYLERSEGFGSINDYVGKVRDSNFDMVVVDVFHNGVAITAEQVAALKYKKIGAQRLALAHMQIATANTGMYYWHPEWKPGSPAFLGDAIAKQPGNHHVMFWEPGWQDIFFGLGDSYIAGLVQLGFDGVVIHGLESWRYFEIGGDLE